MDPAVRRLIEALHAQPRACVLAVTGGGATAAGMLLGVPGASRTILEVTVPYHEEALTAFLSRRPEQFCSSETSQAMAVRAWERANWLAPESAVVGLGVTASLATDRPKRGDHRFHVACHADGKTSCFSLTLQKGAREREGEEAVLARVLLNTLAEAVGIAERVPVPLVDGEELVSERETASGVLAIFLRGAAPVVCVESDSRMSADAPRPVGLLPGAFNPLHAAHVSLATVAARRLGGPVAFELSVVNVDKPPLLDAEVRRRLTQFSWQASLWLTRAPTFVEKARLFPGVVFVVGADTAARIVQPRYYQDSEERASAALAEIRERGCRFLVAGRATSGGPFVTLEQLDLPAHCRDLFSEIPESEFHVDLSSTELRAQGHVAGTVQ